jgi:hypothetical protein
MIFDLNKRVVSLEAKLTMLQFKRMQLDPKLAPELARSFTHVSLN